jgi:hypothetical protein
MVYEKTSKVSNLFNGDKNSYVIFFNPATNLASRKTGPYKPWGADAPTQFSSSL